MGGISIGELVGTISLNDQFSGPVEKVAKALGVSGESFKAVTQFAGGAVAAVAGVTGAIVLLGQRGSDVADVQDGFAGLSARAGETADTMLGALQRGTLNTIDNFTLMKTANEALGSGLITSAKDMETLAGGAKLLSGRVGGDTTKAFDILTDSIAKGKPAGLKQLGIFVDTDAALQAYAASVGKTSSQLSDHEKKTALSAATLKALRGELADAGPLTASFSDRIAQGKVAITNLTDSLGVAIANSPVLAAGMDGIAEAVKGAFGGDQQETVKTLSGYVGKFAIFLVDTASVGVEAARFITNAFEGSKVIFNAILEALFTGIGKAAGTLADLADKAKALPVVGSAFEAVAGGLRSTADLADSLAFGFGDMKEKALESAAETNAAFDTVQGTLGKTRDAMVAASEAEGQLGASAPPAADGVRKIGDAAGYTEQEIKAMEDATRRSQEAMFDMVASGQDAVARLQSEITAQTLTGIDARLFAIQQAQDAELAGYQGLALAAPALYEQITALIQEKYAQQAAAAQGFFSSAEAYAQSAGFQTRDQMEQNVATTLAGYMQMAESGKFTSEELKKAWAKYIAAKDQLEGTSTLSSIEKFELIANAAKGLISAVFGKGKAGAIATAIIDTAQAVVKALASAPPPLNYGLAAAVGAAGLIQINKIRSQEIGFAAGTPGTSFVDFGRETVTALHGNEAVINAAQGATLGEILSDMVGSALRTGEDRTVRQLEKMEEAAAARDRLLPLRILEAAQFARA
jgi:hypothetical protein